MGHNYSKDSVLNKMIEKMSKQAEDEQKSKFKVLLLGTGESGKSTLLKQMSLIYDNENARKAVTENKKVTLENIRQFVLLNLVELVKCSPNFNPIDSPDLTEDILRNLAAMRPKDCRQDQSEEVLTAFYSVWMDEGVQETWRRSRHLLQVQDSLPYFMEKFHKIFSKEYTPTEEDWLRVRVQSTGVIHKDFQVGNVVFNIVDVGGQKSERKKWLPCFDGVDAVIFVAALNEYDQVLFEEENKNRLLEALEVFENTVNSAELSKAQWFLFLNKKDLFATKLKNSPLRAHGRFEDYSGPCDGSNEDYTEAIKYIEQQFCDRIDNDRKLSTNVLCAMDQQDTQRVVEDTASAILAGSYKADIFSKCM